MAKIVIIDDEAPILNLIGQVSRRMGHEPLPFQTGREGLAGLDQAKPELLIVDLRIGDIDGLEIIRQCRERHPATRVVMVTGYGSVETAVEAMKLGAFDYLTKPFALDDLQRTITRALQPTAGSVPGAARTTVLAPTPPAQKPVLPVLPPVGKANPGSILTAIARTGPSPALSGPEAESPEFAAAGVVGESPQMAEILKLVRKIADRDSPVLLEGEFGSGKQTVARTLHNTSRRRAAPFKVLHCSALPEHLLDQELFGETSTIFQRAEGGTVVLEEIQMLPLRLQSQLDGFLDELSARRMAGPLPEEEDFRFVATSSVSLEKWARDGKFREDLFYRISVIPIPIPPLRSRRADISPLVNHFLNHCSRLTDTPRKQIDQTAARLLEDYVWPGNVGELRNAIERACSFADGLEIRAHDLPPKITQKKEAAGPAAPLENHRLPVGGTLSDFIKQQERLFIQETLKLNDGSREKTASMLGVSIATLYRKMELKLEREPVAS